MVHRLKICISYVVVTHVASTNWHQNLPLGCNHQQEGCHCCGLWVTGITNWGEGHTWWLRSCESNRCLHTICNNHICWNNRRSNNPKIKGFWKFVSTFGQRNSLGSYGHISINHVYHYISNSYVDWWDIDYKLYLIVSIDNAHFSLLLFPWAPSPWRSM